MPVILADQETGAEDHKVKIQNEFKAVLGNLVVRPCLRIKTC